MKPLNKQEIDILIVDDTPTNLEVLGAVLERQGYQVRTASNGREALNAVADRHPDLILMDIMMPGMTGYEVTEQLQQDEVTQLIPIIFVSALGELGDRIKALKVGGVDYILKPFQIPEVLARVEAQLTMQNLRRQVEELLNQQTAYYQNLSQIKDDMIHATSHDLKNPLGLIAGYASMLAEQPSVQSDPTAVDFVQEILYATERMQLLIRDLLDLAQIETGFALRKGTVNLNKLLQNCIREFQYTVQEKQMQLSYQPATAPLTVYGDSNRLHQVFENLISNALKYTPDGGIIQVSASAVESGIITQVTDNGLGIPADAIPHLFDRFFRVQLDTHRKISGTGLGLAIVKAIVDQHNGKIWVQSQLGQGSIFSVALPYPPTN